MARICFVTTSPLIVNFFLIPHLLHLREGHTVSLVVNTDEPVALKPLPGIEIISIPVLRKISPLRDLQAIWKLTRLFSSRRYDVVHSFSPKAGLLAMVAGLLARIPVRLHTFTGQVWATRRGVMRQVLRLADKLTAMLATHVLADSPSQLRYLVEQGIVRQSKCRVLGSGSISGVDVDRFTPDAAARAQWRNRLNIAETARVVLFLGRLTLDKGVLDLAAAFSRVAREVPDGVLLMVGPDEEGLQSRIIGSAGAASDRIRFVEYTPTPEQFVAAADVLCLPSYREGFGSVIIEAAACGVPAVSTRIYGVIDAIVENETGLLYSAGSVEELANKLLKLLLDGQLRETLGAAGRERALAEFSQDRITRELAEFYERVLVG